MFDCPDSPLRGNDLRGEFQGLRQAAGTEYPGIHHHKGGEQGYEKVFAFSADLCKLCVLFSRPCLTCKSGDKPLATQVLELVADPGGFLEFEVLCMPVHLFLELLDLLHHLRGCQ